LYREKQPNPDGKPRFVYRSALTEKPIPEPEPEPTPELDVPLAAAEPEELPVHDLMPPVPEEAPTTPAPPISAPPMPAEALEVLRGYFVGDIEAENELLREAFTDVVALLQATAAALSSAAENAAEALTAVGERRRPAASQASQIGVLRETRLQQLIEHSPHNTEVHYKDHAKRSGLLAPDANNALNVAKRTGWRSPEGYTVTQNRRGYYIINSPKEAS
jgi:rubrerythrin